MSIIAKLYDLLSALKQADVDPLAPARREMLGALLLYWGRRCAQPNGEQRPDVVSSAERKPRE
jgi:hypothetical protein